MPLRGGTATIGVIQEPSTFLDWNAGSNVDQMMADLVFHRLARPGANPGAWVPDLADSWETLPDGRSIRFRLRAGISWEDGREVDASDVVFSEERARAPGSSLATYKAGVESVVAISAREVIFHFRRAYPEMMEEAVAGHIYPRHLLEGIDSRAISSHVFNRRPIGSGPFRLERWEPRQYLSFSRKDEPVLLDRLVVRIFQNKEAAVREMGGGGLDYLRKVARPDADRFKALGGFSVFRAPSREYIYIAWNTQREPWSDARVRNALTALIDRPQIATGLEGEGGVVAEGPVPADHPWFDPTVRSPGYDPMQAATLLSGAGFRRSDQGEWLSIQGTPLSLTLLVQSGNPTHLAAASVAADHIRRGGIKVAIRDTESDALQENVGRSHFDGAIYSRLSKAPVDLAACFKTLGQENWAGLSDVDLDTVLDQGNRETNPVSARELFARSNRRVVELQPWTFLAYRPDSSVFHARLRGMEANPREPLSVVEHWWVSEIER